MFDGIFDSHCHYDDHAFDGDRQAVIEGLFAGRVEYLMHASTDEASALYGIEAAKKYENYYTSIGFHPENSDTTPDDFIAVLERLLQMSGKIKAVGEIGLDYHYEGYDRERQIYIFKQQVLFANEHGLPVIVHSRNATEDTMEILSGLRPRGVMHCFSGSAETAAEVVKLGMYIGFTGVLTFKNSKKAKKACAQAGLDRILIETDCPYMAPEPFRGQRSDSSMCEQTAAAAAEIFGVDTQTVIEKTNENARILFGIGG
ncbi:TatD family hydrolase [Ruminococcus sp. NK3A76]|uniref:TatD family hydrolase n=1 Tax=Ruminococcus sp. NK3A76 TaxID=877411 RepID=UPI00048D7C17|nr:TatD family hydrolase [Ruminococcus sp. NK3A76]